MKNDYLNKIKRYYGSLIKYCHRFLRMEMFDMSRNNELAKPMSQNNDDIYYTDQKEDAKGYNMNSTTTYPNAQYGATPNQIIIVDSAQNVGFVLFRTGQ